MGCKGCDGCCKGPGYLTLRNSEVGKYKKFEHYPKEEIFFWTLVNISGPCPYLTDNNLCEIQDYKPKRCEKCLCLPTRIEKNS